MVATLNAFPPVDPRLDHAAVDAARLARIARDRLLTTEGAVTVAMLADGRGANSNAARQWVQRHRRAGRLITVEHDGTVLIPTFQLDEAFDLHPLIADVVAVLGEAGLDGWAVWHWFCTVNPWLDERPVEVAYRGEDERLRRAAERFDDANDG